MGGWVDGHFDIFDIYLNHLSPLQGYFLFGCLVSTLWPIEYFWQWVGGG